MSDAAAYGLYATVTQLEIAVDELRLPNAPGWLARVVASAGQRKGDFRYSDRPGWRSA